MGLAAAHLFWLGAGAYGFAGAASAAYLLSGAIRRIDPDAADASLAVKLMLAPGVAALWPWMLAKAAEAKPEAPPEKAP